MNTIKQLERTSEYSVIEELPLKIKQEKINSPRNLCLGNDLKAPKDDSYLKNVEKEVTSSTEDQSLLFVEQETDKTISINSTVGDDSDFKFDVNDLSINLMEKNMWVFEYFQSISI